MNNDDMYIKTYITRFEQALLDHVRKQVDSETKITIYEAAIQDLQRKLEESERMANDHKSAFDQAILGLQAVTVEKDEFKSRQEKRETEFELICNELEKTRQEKQKVLNEVALLEQKVADLNRMLDTAKTDAGVMKKNYSLVMQSLEDANAELERIRLNKKSKKANIKDSEWIDGDEISA